MFECVYGYDDKEDGEELKLCKLVFMAVLVIGML